jgi:hypothetical protein
MVLCSLQRKKWCYQYFKIYCPTENITNWCCEFVSPFFSCWGLCRTGLLVLLKIVYVCLLVPVPRFVSITVMSGKSASFITCTTLLLAVNTVLICATRISDTMDAQNSNISGLTGSKRFLAKSKKGCL